MEVDMEKYFPMHEGVDMAEEKGQLEQMIEADLLERLEESGENFQPAVEPEPEAKGPGTIALLHCHHEVDFPGWTAYLKALGYVPITTEELGPREILDVASKSDIIVVTSDWYNDEIANIALLLGRFVGARLYTAYRAETAQLDAAQGLIEMPAASLNPIIIGKVFRSG